MLRNESVAYARMDADQAAKVDSTYTACCAVLRETARADPDVP